jgi:hypothetical protein
MIQGQQTQIDSLGFENRYLNDGLRRAAIEAQSARMGRQEAHAKVRQAYADGHRDGRAEGADPTRPIESYSLAVDPGPLAGLTDVPHVGAEAVAAEKIHAMPAGFDYTTASNDPVVAIARKDPFDADTD